MQMARRDLLRLGAAVAAAAATSSCRGATTDPGGVTVPPAKAGVEKTAKAVTRGFPGRPAPGTLYYGASLPWHGSLPAWERELGRPLALHRSYFDPDRNESAQLVLRCRLDLERDRLPHVSTKPPGTWQEVAAGAHDPWLTGLLRPLGDEARPIFLTLHHEPENDAGPPGMLARDFVAMQRRAIRLAGDLAPKVTVVPVLQHWTFDPLNTRAEPDAWLVRDAAAIGLDIYNPWSPTNGKVWRSFGDKADEALRWFGDTPVVIGEYGCRDDPDNPSLAAEWLRDAAEYALGHNIISMSYFNSDQNAPDGSWELRGRTERAFAELLASDWVARPA